MEKAQEYKYYSTQRPVDIGTFPNGKENPPIRIENYEGRIWVEHDTRLAWGELAYAQPLSEKELYHYELKPSRDNPDMRRLMDAQAQAVGKWEDAEHIPEAERLTWFYPDFGSYVVKEFVSPERLAECARGVELQRRCSNNLNQVAIHANTYGGIYPEEISALQRDYSALWGPLSDLLKQLSALVEL